MYINEYRPLRVVVLVLVLLLLLLIQLKLLSVSQPRELRSWSTVRVADEPHLSASRHWVLGRVQVNHRCSTVTCIACDIIHNLMIYLYLNTCSRNKIRPHSQGDAFDGKYC